MHEVALFMHFNKMLLVLSRSKPNNTKQKNHGFGNQQLASLSQLGLSDSRSGSSLEISGGRRHSVPN